MRESAYIISGGLWGVALERADRQSLRLTTTMWGHGYRHSKGRTDRGGSYEHICLSLTVFSSSVYGGWRLVSREQSHQSGHSLPP